jgi:hypothetical protein
MRSLGGGARDGNARGALWRRNRKGRAPVAGKDSSAPGYQPNLPGYIEYMPRNSAGI